MTNDKNKYLESKTGLINKCLGIILIQLVNEHFTARKVLCVKFDRSLEFENLHIFVAK